MGTYFLTARVHLEGIRGAKKIFLKLSTRNIDLKYSLRTTHACKYFG